MEHTQSRSTAWGFWGELGRRSLAKRCSEPQAVKRNGWGNKIHSGIKSIAREVDGTMKSNQAGADQTTRQSLMVSGRSEKVSS